MWETPLLVSRKGRFFMDQYRWRLEFHTNFQWVCCISNVFLLHNVCYGFRQHNSRISWVKFILLLLYMFIHAKLFPAIFLLRWPMFTFWVRSNALFQVLLMCKLKYTVKINFINIQLKYYIIKLSWLLLLLLLLLLDFPVAIFRCFGHAQVISFHVMSYHISIISAKGFMTYMKSPFVDLCKLGLVKDQHGWKLELRDIF
jgi:hypothetical protein